MAKKNGNGFLLLLIGIALGIASLKGYEAFMKSSDDPYDVPDVVTVVSPSADETAPTVIHQDNVPYRVELTFNDFELGKAQRQQKLIVMTQEASVSYTATKEGLWNLAVFKQTKAMVFHGNVTYTVDLSDVNANNIEIDNDAETITIHIPEPEYSVEYVPEETEFFSSKNGLLRFGEMEITPEMQTQIETIAKDKLKEKAAADKDSQETAEKFAILSVKGVYEPVIKKLEKAAVAAKNDPFAIPIDYTVNVVIDD